MIIDSHCHLTFDPLYQDIEAVIARARDAGVTRMLAIAINREDAVRVESLVARYPQQIHAAFGLHPNEAPGEVAIVADELIERCGQPQYLAVGETGLDFFRSEQSDMRWQYQRFREHITAAKTLGKPLVIHSRAADEETLQVLREEGAESGVIHCFSYDAASVRRYLDLGFYISFTGIVTYKSAVDVQAAAKLVPDDRLLVETDSPYLAPVPKRGKSNEPAYTSHVVDFLAALRGTDRASLAADTSANFVKLFQVEGSRSY
ncbi:TatD family hydrolase [Gammaproteobacteria bacterium]|nr:TatD family hydrolase [Gammaproteobacteria bacterium]